MSSHPPPKRRFRYRQLLIDAALVEIEGAPVSNSPFDLGDAGARFLHRHPDVDVLIDE